MMARQHVRKGREARERRIKNTIPAGIRRFWREVAEARKAMLPKAAPPKHIPGYVCGNPACGSEVQR